MCTWGKLTACLRIECKDSCVTQWIGMKGGEDRQGYKCNKVVNLQWKYTIKEKGMKKSTQS